MADARLAEALKRAAEEVEVLSHQPHLTKLHDCLAGWAEVVEALGDLWDGGALEGCWKYEVHERDCDITSPECGKCKASNAIDAFCDAMLGGDDEQA